MNTRSAFVFLFIFAVLIAYPLEAFAQFGSGAQGDNAAADRICMVIDIILSYIEGSFGALVMVIVGVLAIISAAFGQYKAAMSLLIVACGCFVLRSLVAVFFGSVAGL